MLHTVHHIATQSMQLPGFYGPPPAHQHQRKVPSPPRTSTSSFMIEDILGKSSTSNTGTTTDSETPAMAKPLPVHPAAHGATLTTTPTLYKPQPVYEPGVLGSPFTGLVAPHPAALASPLYSLPYGRPALEFPLVERPGFYPKSEYLNNINHLFLTCHSYIFCIFS